MTISFTKGHGTGNDFILIQDTEGQLSLTGAQIAKLCDRNFGIGADGLIFAVKTKNAPEVKKLLDEESGAEWFMDYRNADGSKAEMCGNGIRVFARYLLENSLAALTDGSTLPIATRSGIKDVTATASGFAVDLGRWGVEQTEYLVRVAGLAVARPGLALNLGNPHVVVALANHAELESLELSQPPLLDPVTPGGANVEFVVLDEPLINQGVGSLTMRVYERGVGETMSCGTGVAAAALAIRHWAGNGQNFWKVRVPGGDVAVRMFATEDGEHVGISGAAELVFSGSVEL